MIPEIGHFALLLCLPLAVALSVIPLLGAQSGKLLWMRSASLFAFAQWAFLLLAFGCLANAFLTDDFTVKLVASHSNSALPAHFKFSALWGNHEGSLLLWLLILACWTLAVAWRSQNLPPDVYARAMSVLGMISCGFLLFIIFTSNPFERLLLSTPADGSDLNPLLQDIGLVIHPPVLYVGYVGFSVAFAFAIAALMGGKLDAAWARWTRPWTNTAWAFLTLGIALGSWWAYYELGWGGWWFWDPVENASFMPWLAGTALIHSLSATEKRGVFHSWTVLLAIMAFSLSLLGTFLVRSGILVSVHAFASDPQRGLFILLFLAVVIGGSLLLYALKAPALKSSARFGLASRETFLLANNILMALALAVVLLGTLFPLVMKAISGGTYSVGPPYFNALFVPLMVPVILLMGLAPFINWKKTRWLPAIKRDWLVAFALATLAAVLFVTLYRGDFHMGAFATVWLSSWLVAASVLHAMGKIRWSNGRAQGLSASYWGMLIAHLGIAVTALGIGLTSIYSEQRDVRMVVGDSVELHGYSYLLSDIKNLQGPNYQSTMAIVNVFVDGKQVASLAPEKRFYPAANNVMTEAGIDAGLTRDLYVALGEKLEDGAWAVRVHVKPFVRCIWLGAIMMALGACLAIADKRYRQLRQKHAAGDTSVVASSGVALDAG